MYQSRDQEGATASGPPCYVSIIEHELKRVRGFSDFEQVAPLMHSNVAQTWP